MGGLMFYDLLVIKNTLLSSVKMELQLTALVKVIAIS